MPSQKREAAPASLRRSKRARTQKLPAYEDEIDAEYAAQSGDHDSDVEVLEPPKAKSVARGKNKAKGPRSAKPTPTTRTSQPEASAPPPPPSPIIPQLDEEDELEVMEDIEAEDVPMALEAEGGMTAAEQSVSKHKLHDIAEEMGLNPAIFDADSDVDWLRVFLSLSTASSSLVDEILQFRERRARDSPSKSLVEIDNFLQHENEDWDCHDPLMDEKWQDFIMDLAQYLGEDFPLRQLSKPSGPLDAAAHIQWHYPTFKAGKVDFGHVMDPKNPSLRVQNIKLGLPRTVRTIDTYPMRHEAFKTHAAPWRNEYGTNWDDIHKRCVDFSYDLMRQAPVSLVLGNDNFHIFRERLRSDASLKIEEVEFKVGIQMFGQKSNPRFLVVRSPENDSIQALVFFGFHGSFVYYNHDSRKAMFSDLVWNGFASAAGLTVRNNSWHAWKFSSNQAAHREISLSGPLWNKIKDLRGMEKRGVELPMEKVLELIGTDLEEVDAYREVMEDPRSADVKGGPTFLARLASAQTKAYSDSRKRNLRLGLAHDASRSLLETILHLRALEKEGHEFSSEKVMEILGSGLDSNEVLKEAAEAYLAAGVEGGPTLLAKLASVQGSLAASKSNAAEIRLAEEVVALPHILYHRMKILRTLEKDGETFPPDEVMRLIGDELRDHEDFRDAVDDSVAECLENGGSLIASLLRFKMRDPIKKLVEARARQLEAGITPASYISGRRNIALANESRKADGLASRTAKLAVLLRSLEVRQGRSANRKGQITTKWQRLDGYLTVQPDGAQMKSFQKVLLRHAIWYDPVDRPYGCRYDGDGGPPFDPVAYSNQPNPAVAFDAMLKPADRAARDATVKAAWTNQPWSNGTPPSTTSASAPATAPATSADATPADTLSMASDTEL